MQITYIIQKLEEPENEDKIQEAENSRIGFSQTEEQDNSVDNFIQENSRSGTTQRGEVEEEEDLTDDEELDSTLQSANVLVGDSLLIADYSMPKIKEIESVKEPEDNQEEEKGSIQNSPQRKEPKVFQYNRPSHQIHRDSDNFDTIDRKSVRMSQKDVLLSRLEMENKRMLDKYEEQQVNRKNRKYQSVNHAVLPYRSEEEELVFKSRSKLIRTPKIGENIYREDYEKVTFGKDKNTKPSHYERSNEIRASVISRMKPSAKKLLPNFSTEKKMKSLKSDRSALKPKIYDF